jgi:hypothetical protein
LGKERQEIEGIFLPFPITINGEWKHSKVSWEECSLQNTFKAELQWQFWGSWGF